MPNPRITQRFELSLNGDDIITVSFSLSRNFATGNPGQLSLDIYRGPNPADTFDNNEPPAQRHIFGFLWTSTTLNISPTLILLTLYERIFLVGFTLFVSLLSDLAVHLHNAAAAHSPARVPPAHPPRNARRARVRPVPPPQYRAS